MNEENANSTSEDLRLHFHMVLADVIFETQKGITSHRTQFITQATTGQFPGDRIHQLQNSAAASVRAKLPKQEAQSFTVHDVLFLNFHYCGYMTNAEFYGPGMTAEVNVKEADNSPSTSVAPVADGETAVGDNVVPLNRD